MVVVVIHPFVGNNSRKYVNVGEGGVDKNSTMKKNFRKFHFIPLLACSKLNSPLIDDIQSMEKKIGINKVLKHKPLVHSYLDKWDWMAQLTPITALNWIQKKKTKAPSSPLKISNNLSIHSSSAPYSLE